jgi:hypothetical protein
MNAAVTTPMRGPHNHRRACTTPSTAPSHRHLHPCTSNSTAPHQRHCAHTSADLVNTQMHASSAAVTSASIITTPQHNMSTACDDAQHTQARTGSRRRNRTLSYSHHAAFIAVTLSCSTYKPSPRNDTCSCTPPSPSQVMHASLVAPYAGRVSSPIVTDAAGVRLLAAMAALVASDL